MISRIDGDVSIGEWHEHFIVQISVINENKQEKKKREKSNSSFIQSCHYNRLIVINRI